MQITIDKDLRRRQAPKEHSPPKTTNKYVNTRIYDQTETRGKIEPQTTAMATGEMPPIFDREQMRPKFLGGQYTSKINDKSESKVKNYLIGQCSTREGNDIVEQYFK